MTLSRAERNQRIERSLTDLASLRGVTTAAIVDEDGFVTHIRKDFEIDVDALGAAVQIMYTSAFRAAEHVSQDQTKLVLAENKEGIMILGPLVRGFILVLVADLSAMLGNMRFELKQTLPEMNELLSQ
jgi:predicted regulator of Ras-like GTPase activity (Roadblock/LC7/MglB family)